MDIEKNNINQVTNFQHWIEYKGVVGFFLWDGLYKDFIWITENGECSLDERDYWNDKALAKKIKKFKSCVKNKLENKGV